MNKNKVLIIDASSLIFRSYYACAAWSDDPIVPSFNLLRSWLRKLSNEINPIRRIFAIDLHNKKSNNFKIFKGYKQGRHIPEDLAKYFTHFNEIAEEERFRVIGKDGEEADDVIASLTYLFKNLNEINYIYTTDKDLFQLIENDKNIVIQFKKQKGINRIQYLNEDDVCKMFGIDSPKKIVDLKSMIGDGSDGYPGIKGIGIKRAQKLLSQYHDLNGIYQALAENQIHGKLAEYLSNNKEQAEVFYNLAKLNKHLFKK